MKLQGANNHNNSLKPIYYRIRIICCGVGVVCCCCDRLNELSYHHNTVLRHILPKEGENDVEFVCSTSFHGTKSTRVRSSFLRKVS